MATKIKTTRPKYQKRGIPLCMLLIKVPEDLKRQLKEQCEKKNITITSKLIRLIKNDLAKVNTNTRN